MEKPLRAGAVDAFLAAIGDGRAQLVGAEGLGSVTRFRGAVAGQELIVDGEVVALNALAA